MIRKQFARFYLLPVICEDFFDEKKKRSRTYDKFIKSSIISITHCQLYYIHKRTTKYSVVLVPETREDLYRQRHTSCLLGRERID